MLVIWGRNGGGMFAAGNKEVIFIPDIQQTKQIIKTAPKREQAKQTDNMERVLLFVAVLVLMITAAGI